MSTYDMLLFVSQAQMIIRTGSKGEAYIIRWQMWKLCSEVFSILLSCTTPSVSPSWVWQL